MITKFNDTTLEKQYDAFRRIELAWFHAYIFNQLTYFAQSQNVTEQELIDLYKSMWSNIKNNIIDHDNPISKEPALLQPTINELYDMFNLDDHTAIQFIKRFYEELYHLLAYIPFDQAERILLAVIEHFNANSAGGSNKDQITLTSGGGFLDPNTYYQYLD